MSKIEWTDATWNPITGCTPISEGCQNCYAKRMANRLRGRCGYPADDPFRVTLHTDRFEQPLHWRKPRKVFVCSMGDLFHESVSNDAIMNVWRITVTAYQHTFLILTKRPKRMAAWFAKWPTVFDNVWLGITAENQERLNERLPYLMSTSAVVRFISLEPLLGPIVMEDAATDWWESHNVNWVIVGGETGPGARECKREWVQSISDQCAASGTPYFAKRFDWEPGPVLGRRELPSK